MQTSYEPRSQGAHQGRFGHLALAGLGVALAACGQSGTSGGAGTLQFALTSTASGGPVDPGVARLSHAYVMIDKVTAQGPGGWTTIKDNIGVMVDLLHLDASAVDLGLSSIPSGRVHELRLYVDVSTNQPYVVTSSGAQFPLKVPSAVESGIKLIGAWDVGRCENVKLSLGLDGKHSIFIHPTGHDDVYILRPVIRLGGEHHEAGKCGRGDDADGGMPDMPPDRGMGKGPDGTPPGLGSDHPCHPVTPAHPAGSEDSCSQPPPPEGMTPDGGVPGGPGAGMTPDGGAPEGGSMPPEGTPPPPTGSTAGGDLPPGPGTGSCTIQADCSVSEYCAPDGTCVTLSV